MDLSRQLLGYIERAVRGPSVETCRKIALAYGMEPDDMYERAGHLPPDVVAVIKAQFKPMVTLVRAARNCEPKRIGMMAGRLRRGETL